MGENLRQFESGAMGLFKDGGEILSVPRGSDVRESTWSDHGIWERMFAHIVEAPAMENGNLASTVARAYPCTIRA